MNNLVISIKRFFKNKNTVTILGVLVVLVLLYWGYSSQVNGAVAPVTVPVAAQTIQPRTEITDAMLSSIEVPSIAVTENVYTSANAIIGKYSNVNTVIPKGSMFFYQTLIDKQDLPDSAFVEVGEGKVPYLFSVNQESSFMNSIYPGNKIDIYMKANDTSGKVMIGKLIADLEVIAVKDSGGRNVFENTEEDRQAAYFVFGLEEEIHILLRKATYLSGVELIPVPHGGTVASDGETRVSTEYLKNYINANTVVLEGQEGTSSQTDTTKENSTQTGE
ncbi:MAG: hypothetical protein E7169_04350 [Firmicutes bacterium]|nr:hypothetical protein [Bacillota bacterium]